MLDTSPFALFISLKMQNNSAEVLFFKSKVD